MYWEATYRVTTPMFLGGAVLGKNAELRPSSIRGLLRFWFRALALSKLRHLNEVRKLENMIFGSTKRQSSFLLAITHQKELTEIKSGDWRRLHGLRYLGYGVTDKEGATTRPYLKPGGYFTMQLRAKKGAPPETAFFLPLTLQALGFFGAAGARSRKGFGSLSLETLTCNGKGIWQAPLTVEELKESQKTLFQKINLNQANGSLPEYTAFSTQSHVWIASTGSDAIELLNELGLEMLRYRSYGSESGGKHTLPDRSEAEQNFSDDHDLILDFLNRKPIDAHPRRVVFGLPHNYYFKSRGKADLAPANKKLNRRASPLLIHIHALKPGQYAAVLALLPSDFLPPGEKIEISSGRQRTLIDCNIDYSNIIKFMNRPAFNQSRVVVWP